jgi:hypothetical protein
MNPQAYFDTKQAEREYPFSASYLAEYEPGATALTVQRICLCGPVHDFVLDSPRKSFVFGGAGGVAIWDACG